ncbi:hypothetical protein ACFY6U_32270 [Streptomyces sp. NPDC013157]|uniref:hypothetical protein n=1 Tax=Streptomyces sp. NPDC013157 TaxID=3364861 RepID=UPI0036BFA7C1
MNDASRKKAANPAAPPIPKPKARPSVIESGKAENRKRAAAREYRRITGSWREYWRPARSGAEDQMCRAMPEMQRAAVMESCSGLIGHDSFWSRH